MLYEKKYFGNGQGNFDDVDFILLPNQWVNLENARIGSTDKGVIGTVESIGSTILLSTIQPSVTFVQVGAVPDPANRRFFYFLKDLYGPWDKIVCYDEEAGVFYNVLFSAQVTGGLNFSKDNVIHSGAMVNGLLYWTDFLNQPRRINIEAGINLNHPGTFPDVIPYTLPLTPEVLTVVRKPPAYPVVFDKAFDVSIENNQIKNNAFYFAYQFQYRDGETSTISPRSLLCPYNYKSDNFNLVQLNVPFLQTIDQDVQIINLIVIYADSNNGFIVKTWNKANSTDAAEIIAHNAGISPLAFQFSNSSVGSAIDSVAMVKPFDSVPLLSETLEQGTNRLFLGRNLIGYNTPNTTSLTGEIINGDSSTIFIGYYEFPYTYVSPGCLTYYWYILYSPTDIDGTHLAGYYDYAPIPLYSYADACSIPLPSFPTQPIALSDLTYIGANISDVRAYIPLHDEARLGFTITSRSFATPGATFYFAVVSTSSASSNISILKSDSSYQLGIVFYDQYLRQCGVIEGPKLTTPDREYADSTSLQYGIQWSLSGGSLPNEIPDWARLYSIVVTKSLRTSFFVQARTGKIVYATKDADGNYLFTAVVYSDDHAGIALKLDLLNGLGMGYSFNAGDIIKIYATGGSVFFASLSVIDQVGDYVIAELFNMGDLTSVQALFEIYTPTPQTAGEFFYEVGQIYVINDATTTARSYSVLTGTIPGDVFLLQRGTSPNEYLTENMSPNDTFWRNWFTNAGRVQVKDLIGQRFKQTSVKWSNTFIPGTITNGLSSFDALDEKILPGELGPLRRLVITSKVNNELGAVMLGICEQETASMYLGEQQLVGSAANAFIAQANDVIGTVNILKGSFGTLNPESVVEFRGNVYWVDVLNGKVIQYSVSGLFPISNYKMTRFWKLFCDQFLSMTAQQIEALGSRPFIFSAVDPHHWELLITVPKVLATPPMGYLPDAPYTSYVYPFDIWDGQAKTLVYKINAEPNFWQGSYSQTPEGWVTIQNKLFSFKYGQLYVHNDTDSYCNYYGIQYKSRVMFIANQQPEHDKVYDNMSVEVNMLPTLTYFMSLSPFRQVSNLQDFDWQQRESVLYSQIYRNILTPSATGLKPNGLITGEKMRTYALRVMLEFTVNQTPVELRFTNIGYQFSLGNSIPKQ
jgi:hypothetical protein